MICPPIVLWRCSRGNREASKALSPAMNSKLRSGLLQNVAFPGVEKCKREEINLRIGRRGYHRSAMRTQRVCGGRVLYIID
jgi:hypothetical protein